MTKIKKEKIIIPKPFADGTQTNAGFFGSIRSALRQKSRWHLPIRNCKERVREIYVGSNNRRKWSYRCEICSELKESKEVVVHHKIDAGSLKSFEDLPGFVKRLFCDSVDLLCICITCHDKIHNKNQNNKETHEL